MSTEKERREAKKREKDRKRREAARKSRGSRKPAGVAGADLTDALAWPVGECWVGQNWHARGARLDALFTRAHSDGRVAVAIFELDLEDRGVVDVKTANPVSVGQVQGELIRRSSEESAMVSADPARVVRLVRAAERWGLSRAHPLPVGYAEATRIFGDVRESEDEILTGSDASGPDGAAAAPEGLMAALKRRLGLGR